MTDRLLEYVALLRRDLRLARWMAAGDGRLVAHMPLQLGDHGWMPETLHALQPHLAGLLVDARTTPATMLRTGIWRGPLGFPRCVGHCTSSPIACRRGSSSKAHRSRRRAAEGAVVVGRFASAQTPRQVLTMKDVLMCCRGESLIQEQGTDVAGGHSCLRKEAGGRSTGRQIDLLMRNRSNIPRISKRAWGFRAIFT